MDRSRGRRPVTGALDPRRSWPAGRHGGALLRSILASLVSTAAAAGLVSASRRTLAEALEPAAAVDSWAAAVAVLIATGAAVSLATGCTALAAGTAARSAGRSARRLEALADRLTPIAVRRAVAVGVGVGMGVAAPGVAVAGEVDLGWSTTAVQQPTVEQPTVEQPTVEPPTTPAPAAPATEAAPHGTASQDCAAGQQRASEDTVVVSPGDTLWDLAAARLPGGATHAQIAAAWPRWFAVNRDVIGGDPHLIRPGQVLVAPSSPTPPPTEPTQEHP